MKNARVGEELVLSISYADRLDSSELLTGTPTLTEIGTSDLTFSSQAVNTVALTIDDVTVAIGKAVQCKAVGWAENVVYEIGVSCATDSSPDQLLKGHIQIKGIAA